MTAEARSPTVVVRVQGSSDGVTPQNTPTSQVRAIMGSLDNIYSPSLGLTVPIPDSPEFLIGVYKGEDLRDDLVLKAVVAEIKALRPPVRYRYPRDGKVERSGKKPPKRQIYAEFSYWVADAKERCILCGTLAHGGYVSCPRCTLMGLREPSRWQLDKLSDAMRPEKNNPYFTSAHGPPRLDSEWESYLQISSHCEVSVAKIILLLYRFLANAYVDFFYSFTLSI